MFPLRCLFFDELELYRSKQGSSDNTLDSYMDMTLGASEVHLPPSYVQVFKTNELDPQLQDALTQLKGSPLPESWNTKDIVKIFQDWDVPKLESSSETFDALCTAYDKTFENDDSNLNRRISRMTWLYLKAMAKKEDMAKASQDRLDHIQAMSSQYAERASKFASVDLGPDADLRNLSDDQLPLMASPEQLEDLYRTSHVVGRLAKGGGDFEEKANKIQAGLKAAMDMMKKAGELMEKMVTKMFPNPSDSKDLLASIRSLIELGYKTQTTLANIAKKEVGAAKSDRLKQEVEELKQELEACKTETADLQTQLRTILVAKNQMVDKMRITQGEKDFNKNQLRMITVMTISSIQSQNA